MSDNKSKSVNERLLDSDGQRVGTKEEKETRKGAIRRDKGDEESKSAAASLAHPREVDETTEYLLDTQLVDHKELEREARANSREETKQEDQPYPEDTVFYDENAASNEPFDPEKGLDLETSRYDVERSIELEKKMYVSDKGDDYDIEKGVDARSTAEDSEAASTSTRDDEEDADLSEEVLPGAVRILGIDGDPLADLAESEDEEETQGVSTVPEIHAELVDREEEERVMRESVTKMVHDQIIHDAPLAEVQQTKCSPRMKRWLLLGGIAFVVLAIAVGVSLGVILPRKRSSASGPSEDTAEPMARPLDELLSSVSFDGGQALRTPSTPQNMAYEWLANNTNLKTYTDRRKIQRYTLATLYFGMNGPDWLENTNWLGDADECGVWKMSAGALACTDDEEVVELVLEVNNLIGSLPPEIALLSNSLATLDLSDNDIFGSIPGEIGLLTALTGLWLFRNFLTGTIPIEISSLTAMTFLHLGENYISGSIPTEIGLLTTLGKLVLSENQLSGTIPSEIGRLPALSIWLLDNALTGSIPSEIGLLTAMYTLWLSNNLLSGTIPSEIGHLTALGYLYLDQNQLTGPIPSYLHNMTKLNKVYLYNNDFTGSFTCPEFIKECYISCADPFDETCRSL